MKLYLTLVLVILIIMPVFAQENTENGVNYIPLIKFDFLSTDAQKIKSPGTGLVIKSEETLFVGLYTHHSISNDLNFDYPQKYHSIDILWETKQNRHQYLGILKSDSDEPVFGGLHTFQAAAAYGYELINNDNFSFVLGGGIAVSDFGIEFSNGKTCPTIPVPLIRANFDNGFIKTKFEFLTGPNFDLTIGADRQFRLINELRLDQFRDSRDLLFESSLNYRFFSSEHAMGDFAGIALGIKNDNYGEFNLGDQESESAEDEASFETHYNSVFGEIDLTLLKISGGYAFNGRELYRGEIKKDIGKGYFISIEGMYQF